MRRIVLFMHVSLDGFVAGPNGEMDWINVGEELFDYVEKRIVQTDTALYGRVTYQLMESYWPTAADKPDATRHDMQHSKWYSAAHKVVLSKTMQGQHLPNTSIISDDLTTEITQLKQGPGKEILIFGSPTASYSLMAANLIDDIWLFVNPVLLGTGIPLFKDLAEQVGLRLTATHNFTSGVICLDYEVNHNN